MNMLMERPVAAADVRIGGNLEALEALKASVRQGDIRGEALNELRAKCDRELSELQAEFELLLGELKLALGRMQAGRRTIRRAA